MKNLSFKSSMLRYFFLPAVYLLPMLISTGCASPKITDRKRLVTEKLQRPNKIWVENFISDPAHVSNDAAISGTTTTKTKPPTSEEIKIGRQLATNIATQLIKEINAMGIPAEKLNKSSQPQVNDIVLRGYILSVEQGKGVQRVVVGFGQGAAGLQTLVEGYQMTAKGLRKLGSAKITAAGNKTPGGAVGAVTLLARGNPIGLIAGGAIKGYGEISGDSKVQGLAKDCADTIAKTLKQRFKKEGWIK